eukprot:11541761-Heterocapsa_arctica.AAC.1
MTASRALGEGASRTMASSSTNVTSRNSSAPSGAAWRAAAQKGSPAPCDEDARMTTPRSFISLARAISGGV